jgi:hypothetical protein
MAVSESEYAKGLNETIRKRAASERWSSSSGGKVKPARSGEHRQKGNLGAQFDNTPREAGPHWSDTDPHAYLKRNIERGMGFGPGDVQKTLRKGPPPP